MVLDEEAAESGEQLFVAGRVGQPEVIDVFDDSGAEIVGPNAVDDRSGEVRVLRCDEPVGKMFASVAGGVQGDGLAVEWFGELRFSGSWLDEFTGGGGKDRLVAVASFGSRLESDSSKQVGHAIEFVVGPFLERVVVALCTLNRHAQEGHRDGFGGIGRIAVKHKEVGGSVLVSRSAGGNQVACELVPGRIGGHVVADPLRVGLHGLGFEFRAGDQEQVGPFVGPVVDVFGSSEQSFDQSSPSVGIGVAEKGPCFVGRGEHAERIESGTTQEFGVFGLG